MNAIGIASCVGFFFLVVLFEVGKLWIDSRSSGWRRMARRYPVTGESNAKRMSGRLWMNRRRYLAESAVSLERAGLRLEMLSPLGPLFYPPVLIPWDDITPASDADDSGALPLRIGESATILLTGAAAEATIDRFVPRPSRRCPAKHTFRRQG
jgi:hypothetical protein